MNAKPLRLWSDEPASVDLLAFGAVAETAVDVVLDDALDPVALGVSGPWGSGKSTVLNLIKAELASRGAASESMARVDTRILAVDTDPWRYDPDVGAKASLILEVLNALKVELEEHGGVSEAIDGALQKLAKRVNWVKALKIAARSSITLQLPGIDDLSSLVNEGGEEDDLEQRNLDEFRRDFAELLAAEQLSHLQRVVVLVDDLDRCLPDTVVDTLETMRLFLSVPKMSFIIAADETRVADALRDRYPQDNGSVENAEEPARLYLHKIVQTTIRLPALSRFDTEAYLLLLLLQRRVEAPPSEAQFRQVVDGCTELRKAGKTIESINMPEGLDVASEMQFAARLTPILYEKLRGSPRRVKRFLNDLNVRSSIAERRGIELDVSVVAKLMVLELLMPKEFDMVLGWLACGELRRQLARLDEIAGRSAPTAKPDDLEDLEPRKDTSKRGQPKLTSPTSGKSDGETGKDENLTDSLVRWAKLPPSLSDTDLSPYLQLAASFAGTPLIDSGLPERLRDVAANLLSSSRATQKSVTDSDIRGLTPADVQALIEHVGRMARDRPSDLLIGVGAILRLGRLGDGVSVAKGVLMALPTGQIKVPTVLLFTKGDAVTYRGVLERWKARTDDQTVRRAITVQLKQEGVS